MWLVGQIRLPVAIITKEVLFFKKRNINSYIYLLLKTFCLLWKRLTLAARRQSKLAFNQVTIISTAVSTAPKSYKIRGMKKAVFP